MMHLKRKTFGLLFLIFLYVCTGYAQETEVKYLSGKGKDHTVQWDFYCTDGRKSGEWHQIAVPSQWEQEGFGTYNYGHDDQKADEKGKYKYRFAVPEDWANKHVSIVFEGSMTDTRVKINGEQAGPIHQGSFYRFSYDISDKLHYEKDNLLEVRVSKMSANQSVNRAERQADYWVFGGIFRPVYLEAKPVDHIKRIAIDADMHGNCRIHTYTRVDQTYRVQAQIQTLDGENVGSTFSQQVDPSDTSVVLENMIDSPQLWSPEFPNLYRVKVRLLENDEIVHEVQDRFGFRSVELKPHDGFYVNGRKIMFKGVNRHSFWPSSGRTTSKALSIKDVKMMKDMNMNAVRMSHYPPDEHFLDVCDSLGLFVLDELAGWQNAYDTAVGKQLVKEMITKDVNHPSIVMWNNGNEGGWNSALDDDFYQYDPQNRLVIHPWAVFNDMDNQHYKPYNFGMNTFFNGREVYCPTELLHGLYDGGHGAALNDYWNRMLEDPLSAGMFLWVFADEGVVRTDKNGQIDTDKNHAPDGIVGPYREKEASYYAIKEIWSPIYVNKEIIGPQFEGTFPVENRYFYTNTDQCRFKWELVKFPRPSEESTAYEVIKKGRTEGPSIRPQHKGELDIQLPDNWKQKGDAIYLTAIDPHDQEIYTWSWSVTSPEQMVNRCLSEPAGQKPQVTDKNDRILVKADDLQFEFDKQGGLLSKVVNGEQPVPFDSGPVLTPPESTFKNINIEKQDDRCIIQANYEGALQSVTWTVHGNGILELQYQCKYDHEGNYDYFGIHFNFPGESVNGMKWLGRGPYRVWKNRQKGQQLGVWQKDYNNTVTGESWDYPEFKGYHSDFYWVVVNNKHQPFTIYSADPDMYLRMLTPEPPEGAYNDHTAPPFPRGDISFMYGISPIGTKFYEASELGPQSQKNQLGKWYKGGGIEGTLYFNFDR